MFRRWNMPVPVSASCVKFVAVAALARRPGRTSGPAARTWGAVALTSGTTFPRWLGGPLSCVVIVLAAQPCALDQAAPASAALESTGDRLAGRQLSGRQPVG